MYAGLTRMSHRYQARAVDQGGYLERNFEGTLKITNSQLQQYNNDKEHIMVSHFGGDNGEEVYA